MLRRGLSVAIGMFVGGLCALLLPYLFPRFLKLKKARHEIIQNTQEAVGSCFQVLLGGFRKYMKNQEYRLRLLDGIQVNRD
ncbi:unnamed protein product, partial [Amoebophrya sp. A25]|eukprot:GSA25T00013735001.1